MTAVRQRFKKWEEANFTPEEYREHNKRYLREWRKRNPDYMREYRKRHPKSNYAAVKTWLRKRRETLGDEAFKAWKRAQYQKYRERILASERACRAKRDPVVFRPKNNRWMGNRRARLRNATIGDLAAIAKVYERAEWWRQLHFDVVVDHTMPLVHGGTHEAKNLQIIYGFENVRKAARLDYKPKVVFT